MTLFLERGFEATTVEDIAAAADVSKRSAIQRQPKPTDSGPAAAVHTERSKVRSHVGNGVLIAGEVRRVSQPSIDLLLQRLPPGRGLLTVAQLA
jgi:hypothetical protein